MCLIYENLFEGGNNGEAAPPFCYQSSEDKQMKGLTKEIPIF